MKKEMIGLKFGRMEVVSGATSRMRPNGKRVAYWKCLCDCGREKEAPGAHLRNGSIVSCGCHKSELSSARASARNFKHGLSRNRVHHVWASMIQRCQNPNHKAWACYGGKGISVCESWKSFDAFLSDMGMPTNGMTLDRIDGNKGYSPENCRWATMKTQQRNRCNNHVLTIGGESKPISEWAECTGVKADTICKRAKAGKLEFALISSPKPSTTFPPKTNGNSGPTQSRRHPARAVKGS